MKPSDKACEDVTFELPDTVLKVLTREEIEALRIFGSAEYGFGTLPNGIEYLLTHTGLGFLALPDETAKVPTFWYRYYEEVAAAPNARTKADELGADE